MFGLYFSLGTEHILDIQGYDHILFIIGITVLYNFSELKRVLILVTAFTLGHSISLALAALRYIAVSPQWVEFLIPVTIIISAGFGFFYKDTQNGKTIHLFKYISAAIFGLIHGLGFSSYLVSLLGAEMSITVPLLAFNLGLELGQIIVVAITLVVSDLVGRYTPIVRRDWVLIISCIILGVALQIAVERGAFLL